jgi:hypothetical protein
LAEWKICVLTFSVLLCFVSSGIIFRLELSATFSSSKKK